MEENKITPIITDKTPETPVEGALSLEQQLEAMKIENERLLIKYKRLEQSKLEEDMFISNVFHGMKNYFNQILGFLDIISDGNLEEEDQKTYLNIIEKASSSAHSLSEEFLLWKKSGSNKFEAQISEIELSSFVDSLINSSREMANLKKINFNDSIDSGISVMADPSMLKSVLENLISNAIKFTEPEGNISISCERKDNEVKIYVIDDGRGIPKDRQDKILNSLGDTTIGTSGEKGTGFGLHTCNGLIKKMGGHIDFTSEEGKGATFSVTLPAGSR
ncbi:MAG: HAMP domain-containing sensor histidine kinase [Candidatus Paceibacterota bacterium]